MDESVPWSKVFPICASLINAAFNFSDAVAVMCADIDGMKIRLGNSGALGAYVGILAVMYDLTDFTTAIVIDGTCYTLELAKPFIIA